MNSIIPGNKHCTKLLKRYHIIQFCTSIQIIFQADLSISDEGEKRVRIQVFGPNNYIFLIFVLLLRPPLPTFLTRLGEGVEALRGHRSPPLPPPGCASSNVNFSKFLASSFFLFVHANDLH